MSLPGATGAVGFAGSGQPAVSSLAFYNFARSTTSGITVPSGVTTTDFAVLFDRATNSSGDPTDVTPSGWSPLVMSVGSSRRIRASCKILSGADSGASVTGMNGTGSNVKLMLVLRADRDITSLTASAWDTSGVTDGNPSAQVVAAAGLAVPLAVFGMASVGGSSTAAFSTASPAFDDEIVGGTDGMLGGYAIHNADPEDHTIDQADLGNNNCLMTGYLICS